jgi:glycosyltransferase involved in cell wall biosynthesis
MAGKLAGGIPVVWGIHHSKLGREDNKPLTLLTAKACAHLSSSVPSRIICCSRSARDAHTAIGYHADRMVVVPNGFDTERFRPDEGTRHRVRETLGIPEHTPLVGMIGRFHPVKDHRTFLKAAADLRARIPDARFLLCGDDIQRDNAALMAMVTDAGLAAHCHLLGPRSDVPELMAALDLIVNSSISEAFPNTVGEAMACGVPCVVTNVGDSAWIVAETGRTVPAGDPTSLAAACEAILQLEPTAKHELGVAARRRIIDQFSMTATTRGYCHVYEETLKMASR